MKKAKIKIKNIVALLLTLYVSYIFVNQQITMWNIKKQINDKYAEEQKMKEKNIKLQDEIKMSTSDMYIEKLARERLGFIKQGETPVINIKN
ncbi:FtsB family cell division protein [Clostridium sp. LBM24168]